MDQTSHEKQFPLETLISALKQNGFVISPIQIAECYQIIATYAMVVDLAGLRDHLSPILVRNQREQEEFAAIFDRCFTHVASSSMIVARLATELEKPRKLTWQAALYTFCGVLLASAAIYLAYRHSSPPPHLRHPMYVLMDPDRQAKTDRGTRPFALSRQDTLRTAIQSNPAGSRISRESFDWGDGAIDSFSTHTYRSPGHYKLQVHIHADAKDTISAADTTLETGVNVCEFSNALAVDGLPDSGGVSMNQEVILTARPSSANQAKIEWWTGDSCIGSLPALHISFQASGLKVITVKVLYPGTDSICDLTKDIRLLVKGAYKQAPVAAVRRQVQTTMYRPDTERIVVGCLVLLICILSGISVFFFSKKQQPINRAYRELMRSFGGKLPPLAVRFPGKNALISTDATLEELTATMRRRQLTDLTVLDISHTVAKSISGGGLLQPVYVQQKRQVEFLVFVDHSPEAGLQSAFFDWLADQFQEKNIFLTKYDFRSNQEIPVQPGSGQSPDIGQITWRWSNRFLIIFGNGHQFVEKEYPVFKANYSEWLNAWPGKVLITPVPPGDWGNREATILPEVLPVVAAEIMHQLRFFPNINGEYSGETVPVGPGIGALDLEQVEELSIYCQHLGILPVDCLMQWLAGLAVYPRIEWELVLAIGHAIFRNYGFEDKLNYASLLWITRIPWVQKRNLPAYLRLELLKMLNAANETMVRETIITLLREIKPDVLNEGHFAYEEQQVELITNEFVLYALDPVRYFSYQASMTMFEILWRKGQIKDAASKTYLRNERKSWGTLIKGDGEGKRNNLPIEEYFKQKGWRERLVWLRYLLIWPVSFIILSGVLLRLYYLRMPDKDNLLKKPNIITHVLESPSTPPDGKATVPDYTVIHSADDTSALNQLFPKALQKIGHVIVIVLNGHSFDNLYGQFNDANGLYGADDSGIVQVDSGGVRYNFLPAIHSSSAFNPEIPNNYFNIDRYVPNDQATPDLMHRFYQEQLQIDGGRMDKFALYNSSGGLSQGYYTTSLIPLSGLAEKYTLCDNFYHSAFGGDFLNHFWLIAAASPAFPNAPKTMHAQLDGTGRLIRDGVLTPDSFVVNTGYPFNSPHPAGADPNTLIPSQTLPTIGDRLSEKQVSWAWYSGGWNAATAGKPDPTFQFHHQPFVYFANYADGTQARQQHLRDENDFIIAARNGTLPSVSFVEPLGLSDEHPGYSTVKSGESQAIALINAVLNGPNGKDALIIVTYDQNGGFWDHVAPPRIDRWGPGTRIPTILISPFVKHGFVDHTQYETVSILSLIEQRWNLAPLSSRDANAIPLINAFQLQGFQRRAVVGY